MLPGSAQRRAVLALTFATGGAGLIYQVVWQRYLARLLGNDSLATATVLAIFLAGLSGGYWAWGRRSLRETGLLRTYGLLECAIGLWALAFPFWFSLIDRWTSSWRLETPWPSPRPRPGRAWPDATPDRWRPCLHAKPG